MDALALVPRKLRFEVMLAARHLRTGGGQTILTVGAVASGVIVIIFITSLIFGLQKKLTITLTESLPHVTVRVREPKPAPLSEITGLESSMSSTHIEQQAPQLKYIDDWQHVVKVVRTIPNVRIAVPAVQGQGFASKGGNPVGVSVVGADPSQQDEVTPVTKNLISGKYIGLASDAVVIDYELAKELNVSTGDRIRISSSTGASDSLTIAGIYSPGRGRGSA
ncbi:MAG: ABC transporter permease [Acidobacteriaceae bacterium]